MKKKWGSPAWWTWHFMKQRVLNSSNKDHHLYKDRGIDPRWMDFKNFHRDMGDRPEGMTLDRIDNDKGYCKENCQWATRAQQAKNRHQGYYGKKLREQDVIKIKRDLGKKTIRELSYIYGVSTSAISSIKTGRAWREVSHV